MSEMDIDYTRDKDWWIAEYQKRIHTQNVNISSLKKELELLRPYTLQQFTRAESAERQLADVSESLAKQVDAKDKCCKALQDQLSVARSEVMALKDNLYRIEYYGNWQIDQARQEAALECLKIIELHSWDIDLVKVKVMETFGLEV